MINREKKNKHDVAIISGTPGYSNEIAMKNIYSVLEGVHNKIHIFRLDKNTDWSVHDNSILHIINKPWHGNKNIILRTLGIIILQIHFLLELIRDTKNVKYFIFLQSTQLFLPHLILLKFKGKSINVITRDYTNRKSRPLVYLSYILSDMITVYTKSMIKKFEIDKHIGKTNLWNYNFIDNNFDIIKDISERKMIGYVGRLAPEKNVIKLIRSVERMGFKDDLVIGGFGRNEVKIKKICEQRGIKFIGKVNHEDMHNLLNEIKLFILPSTNEGLPKIVTEAMACGSIVLTTTAGGIMDIIVDGVNGFFLEDVDEITIGKSIKSILKRDDLDKISYRARKTVIDNCSYDNAKEQYKAILQEFN